MVDVSNSPSFDEDVAMNFFNTATRNLIQHGKAAGVKHYIALSVVGTDRLAQDRASDGPKTIRGYFRAKLLQEKLITESGLPFSIVHATQFFEFVKNIADTSSDGTTVRLAPVLIQPMAADDVAAGVGRVAAGVPVNGVVEIAGPDQFRLDEFVRMGLIARNDPRTVVADASAGYFGVEVDERALVPGNDARLGTTTFKAWLAHTATAATR